MIIELIQWWVAFQKGWRFAWYFSFQIFQFSFGLRGAHAMVLTLLGFLRPKHYTCLYPYADIYIVFLVARQLKALMFPFGVFWDPLRTVAVHYNFSITTSLGLTLHVRKSDDIPISISLFKLKPSATRITEDIELRIRCLVLYLVL